ncbi:hypothetical protein PM082_007049 [Marasmius tenuissimus]|nr:hypothetical protein PM082_007049 [Marasmius tenuissimus]
MSEPSSFSTAGYGEPSSSGLELQVVSSGRDHNVNNGSGNFNVHNTNVVQQAQRIRWYIRGTDEEEEEYDQYNEYRRGDIRLLRKIHHEILSEWDWEARRYVPLDCERTIWLGEIVCGDMKGTLVTVECFEGLNASEKWKSSFRQYAVNLLEDSAHLVGLNRSKIPQLILLGELVPAAVFARSLGQLCLMYLYDVYTHFRCTEEELWMDTGRGALLKDSALVNARCEPATLVDYIIDDLHRRPIAEEGGTKDRIHKEQDIHYEEDNTSNGQIVEETGIRLDETDYEIIEPGVENPMEEGSSFHTTGNHSTTM